MEKDKEKNKNRIYIKNIENKRNSLENSLYNNQNKNTKKRYNNKESKYNKENKERLKLFIILAISLFIGIILVALLRRYILNRNFDKKLEEVGYTKEEIEDRKEKIDEIKYFNPDKRARKYLNIFINNIKENKYDEEYFKMYYEFKNIFFPTLQDFENYMKENFPKDPAVKINNFEAAGDLFILFVDIVNKDNPERTLKNMKFVYKEENLMEYVFSFSVKNVNEKEENYVTPPNEMDFTKDIETKADSDEFFDLNEALKEQDIEEKIKEEHEKNLEEAKKQNEN